MKNNELLKNANYCGYYDDTNKFVLEIDKDELERILAKYLDVDIVEIKD